MAFEIEHIIVPEHAVFGKQGLGGPRVYRREGTDEEEREWNDAVAHLTGNKTVSPGGVAGESSLGRIECYRLAEAGHLTLFFFHVRKRVLPRIPGWTYRTGAYGYAPVSELLSIEAALRKSPEVLRIAVGDGSYDEKLQRRFEGPDWNFR